jgi:hypothetical protein
MTVGSVQLAQRRPDILNIPANFGEWNQGQQKARANAVGAGNQQSATDHVTSKRFLKNGPTIAGRSLDWLLG